MASQSQPRAVESLLDEADPVIRRAIRHKLSVTLSVTDHRERNLDAWDVLSEVRLKLFKKLTANSDAIPADLSAYAATVAYHACADYLRFKHPQRASLKNTLRRVMEKIAGYSAWESPDGDLLCGFAGWSHVSTPATSAQIAALRDHATDINAPLKPVAEFTGSDWQFLLDQLLKRLGAPVPLDDLISVVANVVGLSEVVFDDANNNEEEDAPSAVDLAPSGEPSAYQIRLAAERLKLLWAAVLELLPWHRAAYLMNMGEGELEAFPYYGVATLHEIGASLDLSEDQYVALWGAMGSSQAQIQNLKRNEKFLLLWPCLPLEDNFIAVALGVTRTQVIAYRSKALVRLRRSLKCAK